MAIGRCGNNEVLEQLPLSVQNWLKLERFNLYNLAMFQNLARDPSFDVRYLPQNSNEFELPCMWVRARRMQLFGAGRGEQCPLPLFVGDEANGWVRLPVHPTALSHYRNILGADSATHAPNDQPRIWVVPTSSTRTLFAWPDAEPEKAEFIKTTLYSKLFGERRLDLRALARSVTLSQMVQDCQEQLPSALNYFPEPLGLLPRRMPDGGALIRTIPRYIKEGRVMVVPLFALIGGQGEHKPVLPDLLERSGMEVRQFVRQLLCVPIIDVWLTLCFRFGLIIEAHGQDLLLQLTPDGQPLNRFIYRDFEGMQVDWELRASYGLPEPTHLPCAWNWSTTYNQWPWPHRLGEFVWDKWRTSLNQYLHRVIKDVESALGEWHKQAMIGGKRVEPGELTMMFSNCFMEAVENTFGLPSGARYDLSERKSLSRYLQVLVRVRRSILQCGPDLWRMRQQPHVKMQLLARERF